MSHTVSPPAQFTLCATSASIASAVMALSQSPYILFDCEGANLGTRGGALALLAFGTPQAERIFLIDALHLDTNTEATHRLLALLENKEVLKVVWDGRMDFIELWASYGVALGGVLDLQIAEVVAREVRRGEDDNKRLQRLLRIFPPQDLFKARTRWKFRDVHLLAGMGSCLTECKITAIKSKDDEVVQMHRDETLGGRFWMERPFAPQLLRYAAHDIEMMAMLHDHFMAVRWITQPRFPALLVQSARHVGLHQEHGKVDAGDIFRSNPFLPLDVLEPVTARTLLCAGCGRHVSRSHFSGRSGGQIMERCRVCEVVVMRDAVMKERALVKERKRKEREQNTQDNAELVVKVAEKEMGHNIPKDGKR